MASAEWAWGQWMGAWKAEAGAVNEEADRLSRQEAALGSEMGARMKDLNILVIGCRGAGVETAKNLILSNVGSVTVWDPAPARIEDLGANFYLSAGDVGKPRAAQCLAQLKSLNPYCKVDVLTAEDATLPKCLEAPNVQSTGRGFKVVVVTELLPQATLFGLNTVARERDIAFVMAVNMGVTCSVFSDFGPKHVITDADGEPTQMLAVSSAEVLSVGGIIKVDKAEPGSKVLVLTLASDHAMQDDDTIVLDDMRDSLSSYTGRKLKVKRFAILSPTDAELDINDAGTKELLKNSTQQVTENFQRVYEHHKSAFEASGKEGKFKEREITLFNRLVLVLEGSDSMDKWAEYRSGGLVNTVKPAKDMTYEPLEKTLAQNPCPQMMDQELWLSGEGCWIQLAIATALRFQATKGRWPARISQPDAEEFLAMAKALNEERRKEEGSCWLQKIEFSCPSGEPLEDMKPVEEKLRAYSLFFEAELTGFCAFLGGLVAQEVLKKTGKYMPINQWIHHHDASLPGPNPLEGAGGDKGTRYEFQAAILGSAAMKAVREQFVFLVGCGALGCEYMKGLALMGACTAPGSKLIVTDMDSIEVSNLSRQFLFRQADVKNPKSTTAARVVKGWNPDLQVEALEKGVGVNSEDFFDDAFWKKLTLCWNALDNVMARKYTDKCCLWYGLPLLESGTLGTKTNSDVFLPKLTKSYNDATESDANETQIAMCTLRSFPYLPLHCIEYAKQAYFSDYMEFAPAQYEAFRKDPNGFFEQLEATDSEAEQYKALKMIKTFIALQGEGKVDFTACVKQAFSHYCQDFIISIRDLVYQCEQIEKAKGEPFWTGTKRRPREAPWNPTEPPLEAMEFLYACANCYAFVFKVPYMRNRPDFEKLVRSLNLQVPAWSPPGGEAKVDEDDDAAEKVDPEAVMKLKGELHAMGTSPKLQECLAHDFEKDDDTNFHIDFLTIATNMRAANYDIKLSERATVKVTAGRIIPALATTTAMICGLVDNEFLKLAKGLHKGEQPVDQFYNVNINLATGSEAINAFRPEPPIKKETKLAKIPEFTTWDKVEVQGEITVKALVEHLQTQYGAVVQRICAAADDKVCIFDFLEVAKQSWTIELGEKGLVIEPAAVYDAWPQLKMAAQMLGKLPEGGARKNFENQVMTAAKALQAVKDTFAAKFNGPVSQAYANVARPKEDADKQKYFDTVFGKRAYIALKADIKNEAGESGDFPIVKYNFRK